MIVNVPITHNVSALNDNMNKGLWIIWFYADWCGHCKNMEEEWSHFEKNCRKNNNVNVARVRDDSINQLSNTPEINGFPTINLYNNGKSIEQYSGERNNEALMEYINNILKSYKSNNPKRSSKRRLSKRKSSKKKSSKKMSGGFRRKSSKAKAKAKAKK